MKEVVLEILLYILFARISLAEIKLVIPVRQASVELFTWELRLSLFYTDLS